MLVQAVKAVEVVRGSSAIHRLKWRDILQQVHSSLVSMCGLSCQACTLRCLICPVGPTRSGLLCAYPLTAVISQQSDVGDVYVDLGAGRAVSGFRRPLP